MVQFVATVLKRVSRPVLHRTLTNMTAMDAFQKSCYLDHGFVISDQETVQKAVEKLADYAVGCLLTTDKDGHLSGIVSERDVMSKVALLDSKLSNVMVKNISTQNPVSVEPDTSIDVCMSIMLKKDIRHLPLVSQEGDLVGMISIKDCVQIVMDQKEETVQILTNFAMGKSGHFVVD